MKCRKSQLLDALNSNIKELQRGLNAHGRLVASLMTDGGTDPYAPLPKDCCLEHPREKMLEGAIQEAIDVIEESRKAFKSKKLEALRKRLTKALIGRCS